MINAVATLRAQLDEMLKESGHTDPSFDAGRWLNWWLNNPLPALGGARPITLLDTPEGLGTVATILAQTQSGAYA